MPSRVWLFATSWTVARQAPLSMGLSRQEFCQREGKGNCRAPPAVAWPPRFSATRRAPGSQVPWLGFSAPHTRRLIPWVPRKCMTDVGSLALSSPAETCAGGWGLILRVWVPAHSPNAGEAAPEARPAGGALRPPPDRRVHSQQGSEPPRGKRRQPSPVKLKALLAWS